MTEITMISKVTEVVVYPDRARLTATAEMDLEVGNHRIIIDQLPMLIVPESMRVGGKGIARVQIASVDVRRSFYERTPVAMVRKIEDQIRELSDERQVLTDEESILQAQGEYLEGLRRATVEYAKGLARGKTNIEDYERLAEFLQDHDHSLRASMRDLGKQKRDLDERSEKLNKELQQLNSGRAKQGFQAIVDLTAESSGSFSLGLSYIIRKAAWRPLYDIRLLEDDDNIELDITVLAEIIQSSGSDWSGVQLSVSTSRPALSQRAPELEPWYIDESHPQPVLEPKIMGSRMRVSAPAQSEMAMPATIAQEFDQEIQSEAVAKVARKEPSGPATSFLIAGRSDIPGDGSPHKTTIGRHSLYPDLDYLTIPKQVDAVYRRVKIINETGGPLLEGKASLFAGTEYIGSVKIDYTAPGDDLELLFGTEERITVERELTQRGVEKTRLRDRRELSYGYEIKLRNLLPGEIEIEVQDHIPVSKHEDIKVELERTSLEPIDHSDLNLLKWRLVVPTDEEKSIQYEYGVSHPRQMSVIGLVD
ncbi:MAG: mucoidy inhibitor MuiA family protein [Candidatus Promineifilaceae bacterium]